LKIRDDEAYHLGSIVSLEEGGMRYYMLISADSYVFKSREMW